MTPWSWHGRGPHQGSPGILLSELVSCITSITFPAIAGPSQGVILAKLQVSSSPACRSLRTARRHVRLSRLLGSSSQLAQKQLALQRNVEFTHCSCIYHRTVSIAAACCIPMTAGITNNLMNTEFLEVQVSMLAILALKSMHMVCLSYCWQFAERKAKVTFCK